MKKLIMIKYGEISLKGLNRKYFIDALIRNIKKSLKGYEGINVLPIQSRIIVENFEDSKEIEIIEALKKVFGIVYITTAYEVNKDMDDIKKAALEIAVKNSYKTFKVEARRSDKNFPLNSPQISKDVGAYVLINTENLTVDVRNPEAVIKVEIRQKAYVYAGDIKCGGGLPVSTSGVGGLLLSGGIDSPVASYLMNKRGMKIVSIHFHSYPYTSENAKEKVEKLASTLKEYNMGMTLINVSLTKIQEEIIQKCRGSYLTVILRRFMIRCCNELADKFNLDALVTGESLGQVASQTIEGIACSNECSTLPILRPLISMDKTEIIDISRNIGTYDISILPYEDCCTVFVPKHPAIKPKLETIHIEEGKLDIDTLVKEALEDIEILKL